ncbi:hypothetical protein SAMN05518872_102466 [Psychrobacillus sp. OK032]|nr:hypothetical protein SAMN05518872_102466 [Psychrobacillus sp. OK032]
MDIEHPDITHARLTGYPRDTAPQTALAWSRNLVVDDNAFPYEPDEREDD